MNAAKNMNLSWNEITERFFESVQLVVQLAKQTRFR